MKQMDRINCPVERALKVFGDQWSLLIIRELFLEGTRRFRDLETVLGISPHTLSARLKKLEDAQVITRQMYSDHPPRAEYVLAEKGKALGKVMDAIFEWGGVNTPNIEPKD